MSASIEAVKAELESARHALRDAWQEGRSYEARAVNARNVERLEKALAILEEGDNGR